MNDEEKCDFTIKYRWRYERLYMKCCSNRHRVTFVWLHYFEIELNIIVNWESHALTWCGGIRCFGWKCCMEMCVECIVFKWHKRHGAHSQSQKRHTTRSQWLLSVQCSGTVLCYAVRYNRLLVDQTANWYQYGMILNSNWLAMLYHYRRLWNSFYF